MKKISSFQVDHTKLGQDRIKGDKKERKKEKELEKLKGVEPPLFFSTQNKP